MVNTDFNEIKKKKSKVRSSVNGERTVLMTTLIMGGELSEELVTWEKRKKGWRMNCDVGEAKEGLENEL